MTESERTRYLEVISGRGTGATDVGFLRDLLDQDPALVHAKLPTGQSPLRALMDRFRYREFGLLCEYGATHDIFTACAAGEYNFVGKILGNDPSLASALDESNRTPLHWASTQSFQLENGDEDRVVDLLLEHGADAEACDNYGMSVVDHSILYGRCWTAVRLIERGASTNILFYVASDDAEELEELARLEPDKFHWRGPQGETLLHCAIMHEASIEVFEALLGSGAIEALEARCDRKTPLECAIRYYPDAAAVLIEYGADVNAELIPISERFPKSALELAVVKDRPGVVQALLDANAKLVPLYHGRTLLHRAESAEVAEMLLNAGVDADAKDQDGQAPLARAIEEGRCDLARTLIKHGATPTFYSAVTLGDFEAVRSALAADPPLVFAFNHRYGMPLTYLTDDGSVEFPWGSDCGTALHYAIKSGSLRMVEYLLSMGADVNAVEADPSVGDRWTPLHDAVYYTVRNDLREGQAIIDTLLRHGANPNAETHGGYRPIDVILNLEEREPDLYELLKAITSEDPE